jgi:UDP-N-acetylglucosamine--N-acetylmuramyl-(pentapeptide) pyrophosphoryl-undecaprenol N-acetylglucosamine transferase
MRIVIAGGGTGGHTSAGLAVAAVLRERGCSDIHWIGSRAGIEARRVPEAGLAFHPIPVGKLRRYWDWRNVPDLAWRVPAGVARAWWLLRGLRPTLLFATGGFVALPSAIAARAWSIPIVVHEQTVVPGLANRIVGRFAHRVALSFPADGNEFPADRTVVTGNPLRPELSGGSREAACERFGLDLARPIVYVTGGAQGSHTINRSVGELLPAWLDHCQLIHQCGDNPQTGDRSWLESRARALTPPLRRRYALVAHLGAELRDVYAAAELVIGRSGAGTVNECIHLGKPAIYIPLPGASGDEQTANARLVESAGGAIVIPQDSLTSAGLLDVVTRLLDDRAGLAAMGERVRKLAVPDAADRIARVIFEAAGAPIALSR